MIHKPGLLIDGVSIGDFVHKYDDENVQIVSDVVTKTHDGTMKIASYVFYADGTPKSYVYDTMACASGYSYYLSGTTIPVNEKIHLSIINTEQITAKLLVNNEFAVIVPNSNGTWKYNNFVGKYGTLVAWTTPPLSADTVEQYQCTVKCDAQVPLILEDGELQYITLPLPTPSNTKVSKDKEDTMTDEILDADKDGIADNGVNWCVYTISGANPKDANVYISKHVPTDPMTTDVLAKSLCTTAILTETGFTANFDGEYILDSQATNPPHEYVVWCVSDTPGLEILELDMVDRECLAGDTLITMADGNTKCIEDILPGDILMAGDGTPTVALRVTNGLWNKYHTLYTFEDGTVIDEIHDHRFYNAEQGFWQHLKKWNIGEHAKRQDGAEVALISIERINESKEMFGLWTESMDYWANGLLSGETAANQSLLQDTTVEQAVDMMESLSQSALLNVMGLEGLLP